MVRRAVSVVLIVLALSMTTGAQRLSPGVVPIHYDLSFNVDLARARFDGTETIRVQIDRPTSTVTLNAAVIQFRTVTVGSGPNLQQASWSLDERNETATLRVPRAIPRGQTEIRIAYTGVLNDKLRGFYLSKANGRSYAITQFESTDARRAFPCFDEPSLKATFAVSLTVDRRDTAISNGRLLSDTPGPGADQHTLTFSTSSKMSSYLVAMAVGDFACVGGAADGVPIRICATPDKKELLQVALDAAERILSYYNRYFSVAYPFEKLDILAAPDFAAGAMENTGAIFFRETALLADARTASVTTRKTIWSVLAHEMAHQWFGDLVTMAWWNDLWLNEGFATWMEKRPLADVHPEWKMGVEAGLDNQTAFNLDALRTTRAVRVSSDSRGQIEESFDPIAYEKGAAVLRMIEAYLGADAFRRGINAYLQSHAYANATSEDFWKAMAESSGKPVERILPTFLEQPGTPLLDVSLSCGTDGRTTVTLGQQRFLFDGQPSRQERGLWQIPVCLKAAGEAAPTCTLMTSAVEKVTLPTRTCASSVFANAGAQGYYRVAHPPAMVRAFTTRLESDFTPEERLALLGDEWALVRAGRHTAADFLTLASGFGTESSSGVLGELVDRLAFVQEYLTPPASRDTFALFTRTMLQPLFDAIGFSALPGEADDRKILRSQVIRGLGTIGDSNTVADRARSAVDAALAGGPALDPTAAATLVHVAAGHGDAQLYDRLAAAAERAASPEDHYLYLYAAADFTDPALIDRGLQAAISPQMRTQDTVRYLAEFFENPVARPRAWSFVKANWPALEPRVTVFFGDIRLARAVGSFCDATTRDDIKAFFAAHPLPSAARTLTQSLERIDGCIALRSRQMQSVTDWLAAR